MKGETNTAVREDNYVPSLNSSSSIEFGRGDGGGESSKSEKLLM